LPYPTGLFPEGGQYPVLFPVVLFFNADGDWEDRISFFLISD